MFLQTKTWLLLLFALLLGGPACLTARAMWCPFCSAVSLTFTEQLDASDVVVVAKLLELPPPAEDPDADFPKAKFEIVQVIKGDQIVAPEMTFWTQLVGRHQPGQKFLVMGVDPPRLAWSTPMKASDRVFQYLLDIQKLPPSGPQRLAFFQNYFEDDESMLAFDAYDEFARASYDDLIALKPLMQREKLVNWIKDPNVSTSRRRLYFTMLGVCGTADDVKLLEDLIRSDDHHQRAGLDALVASYLTLTGDRGLDLVEQTFLSDPDTEYVDARDVVSALRFHGSETSILSRDRIVAAVRHILDRPKMADMVIPDLARWEDWDVMKRLVQMFKDAEQDNNYVRVPIISYLRACPLPEAQQYLTELAQLDPDAVRRADFFAGGFGDDDPFSETNTDEAAADTGTTTNASSPGSEGSPGEADSSDLPAPSSETPTESPPQPSSTESNQSSSREQSVSDTMVTTANEPSHVVRRIPLSSSELRVNGDALDMAEQTSLARRSSVDSMADRPPVTAALSPNNGPQALPVAAAELPRSATWLIIFVPMGVSVVLFMLLWSIVSGWFERLIF